MIKENEDIVIGKCCANCFHGRLICNTEKQNEYVGCIQYQEFDQILLLEQLEKSGYKSPNPDIIYTGWIYVRIPFGANRDEYDVVDAGIIANSCLISPSQSYCDKFEPKV